MRSRATSPRLASLATALAAGRFVCLLVVGVVGTGMLAPAAPAQGAAPPARSGAFRTWQQAPLDQGAAEALLASTPWTLVGYVGPAGPTRPVLAGTEVTATFQGGRLAGSAGCNAYAGGYTITGRSISLTETAATLRICPEPPGIMEQEAASLAALRRVAQVDVTARVLILRDGDGAILLAYVPQAQTP